MNLKDSAKLLLVFLSLAVPARADPVNAGTVTNDGIVFVRIPAGTFLMGTTADQRNQLELLKGWTRFDACEQPAHPVTVSKPFLISQCEITQEQWVDVMGKNPSAVKDDHRPVDSVSWDDAGQFIKKLKGKSQKKYRLPTEAEWEYCCRAGSSNLYGAAFTGPITAQNLGDYAWLRANAENSSHPVKQKQPNRWGLYDMHGNVWEWCQDWYQADFYLKRTSIDPVNTTQGSERVLRGGSWFLEAKNLRAAARSGNLPGFKSQYVGFRVVCEP